MQETEGTSSADEEFESQEGAKIVGVWFELLIPAYREDAVIHECVPSCLEQDYPADCFDTVVISDRMQPETNASLAVLPDVYKRQVRWYRLVLRGSRRTCPVADWR